MKIIYTKGRKNTRTLLSCYQCSLNFTLAWQLQTNCGWNFNASMSLRQQYCSIFLCMFSSECQTHLVLTIILFMLKNNSWVKTMVFMCRDCVGHCWPRALQDDHHSLLQGSHGLHPNVWHHQWGVLQRRTRLVRDNWVYLFVFMRMANEQPAILILYFCWAHLLLVRDFPIAEFQWLQALAHGGIKRVVKHSQRFQQTCMV